ncbi:lipopolysaccharide biosynthesis protein [Streptomyces sp. bgisy153]|uniref:lipopolysaccharide biosynthesis protein n=1 Tax=Streptomyces sp. bgisy153 TaxID=3413793 RepID=UPI003D72E0DE
MAETRAGTPAGVRAAVPATSDAAPERKGLAPAVAPPADSLFRNAYFLMLSTGVSAVLGLGFWLVAARYYSEEAVGEGSAAIAAMRLLASITATTMIGAVVRFVPRAGRRTGALVWRAYAASSVVVTVAAVLFLLTLDLWGDSYAPLGGRAAGAAFVVACVAWALLTLQDGVLTGLRRSGWVPIGNAVFSIGKLVLLVVLAGALPVLGIFVSWAVAIAFSTLPLGWLIFRRLIPRQEAADRHVDPPGLRTMGRFLAGDSLGALFSLAMINLLPVMVAVRFSAAQNGYFYVAYTVGGTMEFLAINMASSLTAHASHDPRHLADGVRGALRRMTLLLVPVVAVLVLFAPQVLAPFSPDYAEHGTTVLRLLAAGALPRVVVELYIGVLRVQGRTGMLAALQGAMCTLVLGSAALLFAPAGIAGAGWAVLLSMTLIAGFCVAGLRSALRRGAPGPAGPPAAEPAYGTRWARLNAAAGYVTDPVSGSPRARAGGDADTVTLFIGRPGYEREALQADTLALIRRRQGSGAGADGSAGDLPTAQFRAKLLPGETADRAPGDTTAREVGRRRDGAHEDGRSESASASAGPTAHPGPPAHPEHPEHLETFEHPEHRDAPGHPEVPDHPAVTEPPEHLEVPEYPQQPPERPDHIVSSRAPSTAESHAPASHAPAPRAPAPRATALRAAAPHAPAPPELPAPPSAAALPPSRRPPGAAGPTLRERWLTRTLWGLLGVATAGYWAAVRGLPWRGGTAGDYLAGRRMLADLPPAALVAGGLLLVVFAGAVTLRPASDVWLPATALGSALLALYAVPVAFGREPRPVDGHGYERTAGRLADAVDLAGPEPLLRWAPPVVQLLCLVPLWLVLARVGGRLTWPGRWAVLYLVAVGGWVWRQELAPLAVPMFAVLVLAAVLLRLGRPADAWSAAGPAETTGRCRHVRRRAGAGPGFSGTAPAGGSSCCGPPPGNPPVRDPR